jgi:hypothetical protein
MHQRTRLAVIGTLVAINASCTDRTNTLVHSDPDEHPPITAAQARDVPPRSADAEATFVHMSDDSLWNRVAEMDSSVLVGLKAPGTRRGTYQGKLLIGSAARLKGREAVLALRGVTLLQEIDEPPILRIRLPDASTLVKLRRLPFVDYVEPALSNRFSFEGGCSNDPWTGGTWPTGPSDAVPFLYVLMGVDLAWNRSDGRNITVGGLDTGIYVGNPQMTSGIRGGLSSNRTARYFHTTRYSSPYISSSGCSHGTRLGGIMAAPRDGVGAVGVAWGANFVSVRHQDDVAAVYPFEVASAIEGIHLAGQNSNIIAMAWGTYDTFNSVAETIRIYHAVNRLFIGATGTTPSCATIPWDGWERKTLFPASMPEVVAVAAADDMQQLACDSHRGGEVAAYYGYPTTGISTSASDLRNMRGASSATAAVAGAAALIWSKYGTNRDDVRTRLRQSGSNYPSFNSATGYGVINVMRALGGMVNTNLSGCTNARWQDYCRFVYKLASCQMRNFYISPIGGDGPYTYIWSNGSTGSSTSIQLCPTPGSIRKYTVSATVTDADQYGNTRISKSISIEVLDSNNPCPTCPQ